MRVRARQYANDEDGRIMGYYDHRRWRSGQVFEYRVEDMTPVKKGQEDAFIAKGFELIDPLPDDKEKGFVKRALPRWVELAEEEIYVDRSRQPRKPMSLGGPRPSITKPGKPAEVNKSTGDAEVI